PWPSGGMDAVLLAGPELLDRSRFEVCFVVPKAADADLAADVILQFQTGRYADEVDVLRLLRDEAGFPAAPLGRLIALHIGEPVVAAVAFEASDYRDRVRINRHHSDRCRCDFCRGGLRRRSLRGSRLGGRLYR